MALPVVEQIAVKVKARLALIDTDDGYETTVSGGVVRPTRLGDFQPKDYQIIVVQGTNAVNNDLSHPGNPPAIARDVTFEIAAILRPSEELTTSADTLRNTFAADVIKALTDATAWHNWDGLAIDSNIGDVEPFLAGDGSGSGFKMPLVVTYRTDENNPYNVRG